MVAALTGTGALSSYLFRNRTPRQITIYGTTMLALGTLLTLVALHAGSLTGFLLAAVIAVPLGIAMGTYKPIEAFFEPFVSFARYLPASAFIPLLILWVGIGEAQKLTVIFIGCFFQLTLIMRLVRAEMLEVMRADYIKFARARGLDESTINFRHALRNTMVPVVTITGLQLGSVIAFAIVTETVFNWPGLGALFVRSVEVVDIPVMAAYLMFVGLVFVIVNLIVDLIYFGLDPRLRTGGTVLVK